VAKKSRRGPPAALPVEDLRLYARAMAQISTARPVTSPGDSTAEFLLIARTFEQPDPLFFFLAYRRSQTDRRRELLRIFNLEIPQKIRPLSCPVERLPRGCASSLVSRCLTGNRPPGRSTKNAQLDSNLSSAVKYETQRTKSDERIKGILMTKLELGRLDKCKEF
jgi:hypothetical protein